MTKTFNLAFVLIDRFHSFSTMPILFIGVWFKPFINMFLKFCLPRHILQVSTSKLSPITVVMSGINFLVLKTQLVLKEISYGIMRLQRKLILNIYEWWNFITNQSNRLMFGFYLSDICYKCLQCISLPWFHILLSYFCLREHCYFDRCCYPCCDFGFSLLLLYTLNSPLPAHSLSYYRTYLWGKHCLKGVLKIISIYCNSINFYKFDKPTKMYN